MLNKNYNEKRHSELLKKKSMGINLQEYSSELGQYSCMLEAHLDWQGREGYLKLIENFQKGKIQDFEFCFAFEERGLLMTDILDILESNLILLSPHEKSNHFSSFVSGTIDVCRSYIENAEDNDEDSKIEFENSIEEIYLQLQSIVKDYRTNYNVSRDFSQLVDQLNWENQDQYIELINEFLKGSSNFLNFKERYQSIVRVGKELESNSISLKIHYQALGFSNHILILIQLFDSYQTDYRISPKVFKSWVRTLLFEMENHYSSNFDSRLF
jgi:hypothetical protein